MWRRFPIRSPADFSLAPALLLIVIVMLPTALVYGSLATSTQSRRWLSFSLRTLLAVVTAIALSIGWYVRSDIVVSAMPEQPEYMLGEPGTVLFKVANRSGNNLGLVTGGDYGNAFGRPESFRVTVVDADGQQVRQPVAGMQTGGLVGPDELPAKGQYVFRLFLPHWATFDKPGRYTMTIRRKLELVPFEDGVWVIDGKREIIDVSATTTVSIIANDPVNLGKIIAKLGDTMLGDNYEQAERAEKVLIAMHDDRVVPYFVRRADQTYPSNCQAACRALGHYNDDRALETLNKIMKTTASDIDYATTRELAESSADNLRHSAIHAIRESPHPKAIPLLWTFANDPYHEVRLTILLKAAELHTPEAHSVIKKMTTDDNERVRNQAIFYQKQLAKQQL